MNIERTDTPAENALMVLEQLSIGFEDIGQIEFQGLSTLKSSLFGGYNKEAVLDTIEKILAQSESQFNSIKRIARAQEARNVSLTRQNASLKLELHRLIGQMKSDQEDFVARSALKEEQIELLQRENQKLREKIEQDKDVYMERAKQHIRLEDEAGHPYDRAKGIETLSESLEQSQARIRSETEKLLYQVSEQQGSGAFRQPTLASRTEATKQTVPEQVSIWADVKAPTEGMPPEASTKKRVPHIFPEFPNLTSGGDWNWDLDSILKEFDE